MGNWIKLYDKMLEWQWYSDTIVKVVFLHCLLKANYVEKKSQDIVIKRGQFLTSLNTLSQELNLGLKQVRNALEKLQETDEIHIEGAQKRSLITVCKYDSYQQKNSDLTFVRASKGHDKGTIPPSPIDAIDNINNNSEYKDIKNNNINPNGCDIISKKIAQPEKDLFGNEIKPKRNSGKGKSNYEEILIQEYDVKEQYLRDWLIARKKKPITETVLQYLVREAAKANISVAEAVRVSAENSWQGFKADWYLNLITKQNGIYNRQRQDSRREGSISDFAGAKPEDFKFRD